MTATATRCRRCSRQLRVAASVAAGIGPKCARIEALETALAETTTTYGFTAEQQAKAAEVFADSAIVVDLVAGRALVAGSTGTTYTVSTAGLRCTCRAAQFGKSCYHQHATLTALALGQAA